MYVDGSRGGVEAYALSPGAPDAIRRPIKDSFDGRSHSWRYVDDEWYLAGPCEDDPTPTPSAGAAAG